MKNSLFSVLLFCLLLGFLFYADYNFKELCTEIVEFCDDMEDKILIQDKETSFEESMDIFNMIEQKDAIASIYINHMDYDILLNEALKLSVYIEQDDFAEADASLHLLKYTAEHLRNLQVPNIKNLF